MDATLAHEPSRDTRALAWTRGTGFWTRGNERVATLQKALETGEQMTTIPSPHDAARALDEHLALLGSDQQRWIDLFADDAVVEFPYATALGLPDRFVGKEAIDRYFRGALESFREIAFRDARRYPTTDPDTALVEVHGSALIGPANKRYEQDYVMLARTRGGKIVLYREYWNPVPALEAFGGTDALGKVVKT